MKTHISIGWLAALALVAAPAGAGAEDRVYPGGTKVHYAKTEVEKAAGKCVRTVIGGALIGGLMGGLIGGKRGLGTGALVGTAAGAGVCAVIMANAKHRDQIIQAQIASATYQNAVYMTSIPNDKGEAVAFAGRAGADRTLDGSRLMPVRYKTDAGEMASPALDTGGRECRPISGTLGTAALPSQLVCRTPQGDWRPYEEIPA